MGAQLRQLKVTAGDETLARVVAMGELKQIAFIEEIGLDMLVIQSMPSLWRIASIDFCEIMPRSPTITSFSMPKSCRNRCTYGKKVSQSLVLPSCTLTATGQPRGSVSKP
jgi:hypothetical protein